MATAKRRARPKKPADRPGRPSTKTASAARRRKAAKPAKPSKATRAARAARGEPGPDAPVIAVRRIHRRDLNRVFEFLKLSFRQVNLETVEYQRPRSKKRFMKTYDEEGIDQLVFEVDGEIVAYAECAHEVVGTDNWINESYFERRKMRPLFVEELAVHPKWNGRGVGSFVMQQLEHLAKVRGLSHLVLEVAENNEHALTWYRKRGFRKLDAAIFMSLGVDTEPELLPPMPVTPPPAPGEDSGDSPGEGDAAD
ncbi:MAG TPA: GNAT family N-acetyltransferase [Kofleriaceae bacterium]|jgi:ribosomal protein S18 acetylase RimI-like enzyme|nr:GNAT family N-acetyltransferase [Kofleriaceae bacterium]